MVGEPVTELAFAATAALGGVLLASGVWPLAKLSKLNHAVVVTTAIDFVELNDVLCMGPRDDYFLNGAFLYVSSC